MAHPAIAGADGSRVRTPSRGLWRGALPLAAVCAILMAVTRPAYLGDTFWYIRDIQSALTAGWTHSPRVFDFAHLALRPMGIALSRLFLNPAAAFFNGEQAAGIALLLVIVSTVSAFLCAVLIQRMVRNLTGNSSASLIAAAAFLCASAVLNYSRSATSYLPGLACATFALFGAGFSSKPSLRTAIWSGVSGGLAALFWLPYAASLPATLLAGLLYSGAPMRKRVRLALVTLIAAAAVVAAAYAAAAIVIHATTWSGIAAWIDNSLHNELRDRKALRMVTGLPRSIYELGQDAVWIKWRLFDDPYAKVAWFEALRGAFAKLALFYGSVAALIFLLTRSRQGRKLTIFIAAVALPHICAALVFESGSPERYLPALPALFVGFGYALNRAWPHFRARIAVAALCCAHLPFNLAALSAPAVARSVETDSARIAALASLGPESRIFVINPSDGLFILRQGRPFDPLNRASSPETLSIVPVGSDVPYWRGRFACVALGIWNRGGEVWVTRRVLSASPQRSWLWVEGDYPGLGWSAIHGFFSGLKWTGESGGADGFFRIDSGPEGRRAVTDSLSADDLRFCPSAAQP